jgi:hypothetical protein
MTRRRLLSLCSLAAFLTVAAGEPAQAHDPVSSSSRWRPPVARGVDVTIEDAFGRSLRTVRHQGKLFVAGEQGQRYTIRLHNPSAERLEVVVSVDGRDVVSGSPADFARNRGYVVEPFGLVRIDGFRTSLQSVAAFRFSSVEDSYSARRGTAGNVGVIGVAVFHEQQRQPLARAETARSRRPATEPPPSPKASAKPTDPRADSAPSSASRGSSGFTPAPTRELGTAFGEQRSSVVVEVPFVRRNARRPDFVTTVTYDTPRGLAARGVPIEPVLAVDRPSDDDLAWPGRTNRFAPPPSR